MKRTALLAFLFGSLLTASALTWAKDESSKTYIHVDEASGHVDIIVDGQPIIRVDADGLHVNGSVEYSDVIVDVGDDGRFGEGG